MPDRDPTSTERLPSNHLAPGLADATGRPAPGGTDWRAGLLAAVTPRRGGDARAATPNRLGWPGYASAPAVWWGEGPVAGLDCVVAVWEFDVYGGSFGEIDAAAFAAAADHAAATGRPLLSFLRSGGTRLQEGVAGLVGLPRATLAAAALDDARVPHVAVVDHPTTGGVWVTIAARADLRCAVAGATVGFAGPRVVAAVTGTPPPAGSHTAEAARAAGLVDAVVEPADVGSWLATALAAAAGGHTRRAGPDDAPAGSGTAAPGLTGARPDGEAASRGGWRQVLA
ncbi:carboxyl transferase domain-containing protein, partial [Frankia nepalensis]